MLGELDIVELHEAGARDAARRVAGRIGNEVQVDLLHSHRRRKPVRRLWTVYRLSRPSISPPDRSDRMPCRRAQRRSGSGTAVMESGGSLHIPLSTVSVRRAEPGQSRIFAGSAKDVHRLPRDRQLVDRPVTNSGRRKHPRYPLPNHYHHLSKDSLWKSLDTYGPETD